MHLNESVSLCVCECVYGGQPGLFMWQLHMAGVVQYDVMGRLQKRIMGVNKGSGSWGLNCRVYVGPLRASMGH